MKSVLYHICVANLAKQKVDYNKKFLTMVRTNLMFDDGGG